MQTWAHKLEKGPDPTLKVRTRVLPAAFALKKKLVIKNLKITFRGGIMRAILKATMRESDFFLAGVTLFTKRRSPWEGVQHTRLREHCEEVSTLGFRSIFLTFPLRNPFEGVSPIT